MRKGALESWAVEIGRTIFRKDIAARATTFAVSEKIGGLDILDALIIDFWGDKWLGSRFSNGREKLVLALGLQRKPGDDLWCEG